MGESLSMDAGGTEDIGRELIAAAEEKLTPVLPDVAGAAALAARLNTIRPATNPWIGKPAPKRATPWSPTLDSPVAPTANEPNVRSSAAKPTPWTPPHTALPDVIVPAAAHAHAAPLSFTNAVHTVARQAKARVQLHAQRASARTVVENLLAEAFYTTQASPAVAETLPELLDHPRDALTRLEAAGTLSSSRAHALAAAVDRLHSLDTDIDQANLTGARDLHALLDRLIHRQGPVSLQAWDEVDVDEELCVALALQAINDYYLLTRGTPAVGLPTETGKRIPSAAVSAMTRGRHEYLGGVHEPGGHQCLQGEYHGDHAHDTDGLFTLITERLAIPGHSLLLHTDFPRAPDSIIDAGGEPDAHDLFLVNHEGHPVAIDYYDGIAVTLTPDTARDFIAAYLNNAAGVWITEFGDTGTAVTPTITDLDDLRLRESIAPPAPDAPSVVAAAAGASRRHRQEGEASALARSSVAPWWEEADLRPRSDKPVVLWRRGQHRPASRRTNTRHLHDLATLRASRRSRFEFLSDLEQRAARANARTSGREATFHDDELAADSDREPTFYEKELAARTAELEGERKQQARLERDLFPVAVDELFAALRAERVRPEPAASGFVGAEFPDVAIVSDGQPRVIVMARPGDGDAELRRAFDRAREAPEVDAALHNGADLVFTAIYIDDSAIVAAPVADSGYVNLSSVENTRKFAEEGIVVQKFSENANENENGDGGWARIHPNDTGRPVWIPTPSGKWQFGSADCFFISGHDPAHPNRVGQSRYLIERPELMESYAVPLSLLNAERARAEVLRARARDDLASALNSALDTTFDRPPITPAGILDHPEDAVDRVRASGASPETLTALREAVSEYRRIDGWIDRINTLSSRQTHAEARDTPAPNPPDHRPGDVEAPPNSSGGSEDNGENSQSSSPDHPTASSPTSDGGSSDGHVDTAEAGFGIDGVVGDFVTEWLGYSPDFDAPLKVLTFNWGGGRMRRAKEPDATNSPPRKAFSYEDSDVPEAAKEIRDASRGSDGGPIRLPDVICLQEDEIDPETGISKGTELARLLGYRYVCRTVMSRSHVDPTKAMAITTLSKLPIRGIKVRELPLPNMPLYQRGNRVPTFRRFVHMIDIGGVEVGNMFSFPCICFVMRSVNHFYTREMMVPNSRQI